MSDLNTSLVDDTPQMQPILEQYEMRLIGESKRPSTVKTYLWVAGKMFETIPETESVSREDVLRFRDSICQGKEQNTIVLYTCAINSLMGFLQKGIYIKPPKRVKKVVRPLRAEEVQTMVRAVSETGNGRKALRDKAIILLLVEGALRRDEARNLLVNDIDFERGEVVLRSPKGKHDRVVPLTPTVTDGIKDYLENRGMAASAADSRFLFLSQKGDRSARWRSMS